MQKIDLCSLFEPRTVANVLTRAQLGRAHTCTQPLSHKRKRRGHPTYEPHALIGVAGSRSASAAAAGRPGTPAPAPRSPRGSPAKPALLSPQSAAALRALRRGCPADTSYASARLAAPGTVRGVHGGVRLL